MWYGELLIMPANGRWDLIRRLKFNQAYQHEEKLSVKKSLKFNTALSRGFMQLI